MISKELLSEVLGFKIENLWIDGCLIVWKEDGMSEVNIYQLAHKCKKWALINHNATISSSIYSTYSKCWDIQNDKSYVADTEAEAIFKACQWILDEKGE